MKVPPLIINLKNIDKPDKQEKDGGKHEKHEKHKEHKKHKKHKKHKHKHHHHDHEHSSHHGHNKEHRDKHPTIKILNPPLLEPVGLPEPEHSHLFPYQSSYAPPSPVPYPHVLHPVPTPPSQLEQKAKLVEQTGPDEGPPDANQSTESQPPVLEDKVTSELPNDSKQSDDNEQVIEPPATLEEAPRSVESIPTIEQHVDSKEVATQDVPLVQEQTQAVQIESSTPLEPAVQEVTKEIEVKKAPEPNAQMSFLQLSEDGGVRLNILAPIKQSDEGNEKILNLEQICGQLQDGLDVIPSEINEEETKEQHQVNPVEHIDPPTFGSYLPTKDSTFANITKEDSEALLEIYGGNATAFEYAESLQNYANGTNYLMKMVDSLLDLLTEGKHNKEAVPIRQKLEEARREEAKKASEVAAAERLAQNGDPPAMVVDETSKPANEFINAQADQVMEVDQQGANENQENSGTDGKELDEVQLQLNEIDTMLSDLRRIQDQRLSSSPAPVEPDEAETKLADEILEKMTKLIKEKTKPSEICDSSSILKALGIPSLDIQT